MSTSGIEYSKRVETDQPTALAKLKDALKANKWGVLTDIDVKAVLNEKLGVEMENYNILDVCNPRLANQAFGITKQAGLVVPCKMTVYSRGGETRVALYLPSKQLPKEIEGYEQFAKLLGEAEASLRAIVDGM